MMFNPSLNNINKGNAHKKAVAEVTKWVTDALTANDVFHGEQFQVMVTEILCNEPNCAPIETLVIVMLMSLESNAELQNKNSQKWANKILKPVAEVSKEDVTDLINEVFLSTDGDQSLTAEPDQKFELFEVELSALVDRYRGIGSSVTSCNSKLISILQKQVDVLTQGASASEELSSVVLPTKPTRTVTAVTMKPNKVPAIAKPGASPLDKQPSVPTPLASTGIVAPVDAITSTKSVPAALEAPSRLAHPAEVTMAPKVATQVSNLSSGAPKPVVTFTQPDLPGTSATLAPRHKKGGTRPRGCPCCDPDNLDNIIDSMLFSHYPQT